MVVEGVVYSDMQEGSRELMMIFIISLLVVMLLYDGYVIAKLTELHTKKVIFTVAYKLYLNKIMIKRMGKFLRTNGKLE